MILVDNFLCMYMVCHGACMCILSASWHNILRTERFVASSINGAREMMCLAFLLTHPTTNQRQRVHELPITKHALALPTRLHTR